MLRALPVHAGMVEPTRHAAGSDADLMRRFAAGEALAFNALYQRYELRVFRYLLRNLRDRALAEDLLQDIWFAVAREASRYQPLSPFSAWLFRMAHNRMVDAIRAARPEVSLELVTSDAAESESLVPSVAGPYAEAIASEELAAVLAALAQLPEEQCQAFLLQQEGELSIEDIAAVVGCPFETAKSRLRYARSRLRELLQGLL
jgi:RNA polymerase sigma factor (sigma-70 family)